MTRKHFIRKVVNGITVDTPTLKFARANSRFLPAHIIQNTAQMEQYLKHHWNFTESIELKGVILSAPSPDFTFTPPTTSKTDLWITPKEIHQGESVLYTLDGLEGKKITITTTIHIN